MQTELCLEQRVEGIFIEDRKKAYYKQIDLPEYAQRQRKQQWTDFFGMYTDNCSNEDAYVKQAALLLSGRAKNEKGKRIWKWKDRLDALRTWEKERPYFAGDQKRDLKRVAELIDTTYMHRKQSEKLSEIKEVLNLTKNKFSYVVSAIKKPLQYFAFGLAGLGILTCLYVQKPRLVDQPPQLHAQPLKSYQSYTVQKGECLWDIVKKYYAMHNSHEIYTAVDKIALQNGKGSQNAYPLKSHNPKNPHVLLPGQKLRLPTP
jgi:hypothetical protein